MATVTLTIPSPGGAEKSIAQCRSNSILPISQQCGYIMREINYPLRVIGEGRSQHGVCNWPSIDGDIGHTERGGIHRGTLDRLV